MKKSPDDDGGELVRLLQEKGYRKIGIPLEIVDDWPPFGNEFIWVQPTDRGFIVLSVPFFIPGLAEGDVIETDPDEHGYVDTWQMIAASGNSTVWILEVEATNVEELLEKLGCNFERAVPHELIAVNVPPTVPEDELFAPLDELEARGAIAVAVPADRFSDEGRVG